MTLLRPLLTLAAASALLLLTAATPAAAPGGLPAASPAPAAGYTRAEVTARMSVNTVAPVEGLWRLVPDGATIAIERCADSADSYDMTIIEAPDRSIRPGTLLGRLRAGADPDVFDADIYTARREGRCLIPRSFTLTLDHARGSLEFRKHRSPLRINLWHFVPFLWRYSVRLRDTDRQYRPGALRLYPSPARPAEPVYL